MALGGVAFVEELPETPPKPDPHALVRAFSVESQVAPRAAIDAKVQKSEAVATLALATQKSPADDSSTSSAVQDFAELMSLLAESDCDCVQGGQGGQGDHSDSQHGKHAE